MGEARGPRVAAVEGGVVVEGVKIGVDVGEVVVVVVAVVEGGAGGGCRVRWENDNCGFLAGVGEIVRARDARGKYRAQESTRMTILSSGSDAETVAL